MKRIILAALLAPMTAAAQNVTDQVDRFTGQRKIDYTAPGNAEFGKPLPGFMVRQGGDTPISAVRFMIAPELGRYGAQSAQFIGCKTVDWLVDGQPVKLGVVVHSMQRFDRLLVEFVTQEIAPDQLAAFGAAHTVEYRICGKEGALSPTDLTAARQIAALASGEQPPAQVQPAPAAGTSAPPSPATDPPKSDWRNWGGKGN